MSIYILLHTSLFIIYFSVPPEVQPTFNQSQLAFRDKEANLNFTITQASPDIQPANVEWIFESEHLSLSEVINNTD